MCRRIKILFLMLTIFLASCFSKKDKEDCKRFRVGNFIYRKNVPDSCVIVSRNDSIQTETDAKKSFLRRSRITWKASCEYELSFLSRDPAYSPGFPEGRKILLDSFRKIPLQTIMVAVGKDYYVFESKKEGVQRIFRDTMWVLK